MKTILKVLRLTVVLILICGLAYPLLITGIGQVAFNHQANGSVIEYNGKEVGSELIGQQFTEDKYFVGRISAVGYNTSEDGTEVDATSGSNNLGPTSEELKSRVEKNIDMFLEKNPKLSKEDISSELISQSGSGLDPDITVQGAKIQIPRIIDATGISEIQLNKLIEDNTEGKLLGLFGEEHVNVLKLNIGIDELLK
ncbi:MAG: potassium-transporting ATPase subunit KdpC [Clostridium sp.]